ncbi:response regulator transcription factor [Colwellia sp. Arc7-D]|uniref:response regulator transcription factor n=1 Tax=Colwellia sp. Arc7-D TaxID=2161872 RepID=UPI000D3944AF|nr:response regulator transcription factor [Colwellia sp. Arc7-D]AWB58270.1 DNA-binding response regulator [Colwellia sp. Arc7-D]
MYILLVEDDAVIADAISIFLSGEGLAVEHVASISHAKNILNKSNFDLCILDLNLPDGNGITWLTWLRKNQHSLPVLILTASNSIDDKLTGLKNGADDYLVKPFDLRELLARLYSIKRRTTDRLTNTISHGLLTYHLEQHKLLINDKHIPLSRNEDLLLKIFLNNPQRILSESQLKDVLYGTCDDVASNALNVHIFNLRKKIGTKGIETIRGFGFRLGSIEVTEQ